MRKSVAKIKAAPSDPHRNVVTALDVATPDAARQILQLNGGDRVGF